MATRRRKPATQTKKAKKAKPAAKRSSAARKASPARKRAHAKSARSAKGAPRAPHRPLAKAAPPSKRGAAPPGPRESPLDDEMLADVDYFVERGLRLLFEGNPPPRDAIAIIDAIRTYADDVRDGRRALDPELALTLSCLWARQVCRTLGWTWARVAYPEAAGSSIGIVSPDRAHAIFPYHYLKEVLEDGDRSNTTLLLFNMLRAGSLPNARPGTYAAIS